jgi:hypothetical protein
MQFLTLSVGTTEPITYAASADRLSTSLIARQGARLMSMLDMANMSIGDYSRWEQESARNLDLLLMRGHKFAQQKDILIILFKFMDMAGILGIVFLGNFILNIINCWLIYLFYLLPIHTS